MGIQQKCRHGSKAPNKLQTTDDERNKKKIKSLRASLSIYLKARQERQGYRTSDR
jgi:hypothetical protein